MGKFRQLIETHIYGVNRALKEDDILDQIIDLYGWRRMGPTEVCDLGRGRKFEIIKADGEVELWFDERGRRSLLSSSFDDRQGVRDLKEYMHDWVAGRWRDVDDMIESNLDF